MRKIFNNLKRKWGIKSDWDAFLICVVFSLAGMAIVFVRKPVFHLLHITHATPLWIKICVYIPILFPTYQLNLLIFGALLGQFNFFLEKEKKLWRFILGRNKSNQPISPVS